MPTPLIGLTSFRSLNRSGLTLLAATEQYIQAVSQAGGAPLLIPLGLPDDQLQHIFERLDALLFTGGGDIHPRRFERPLDTYCADVDEDRDRVEISLLQQAARRGLPFLGICRGFQVANVALGGDLYTDILAQHPGAQRHDYYPDIPRDYLAHSVSITPGSRLHQIIGAAEAQVNSLHHQGARRIAPELQPVAFAPDGLVEAVELPDHPFGLAVQWHPEWLQDHYPMRRLFHALVAASQGVRLPA